MKTDLVIVKLERARNDLAEAKTIQATKKILDIAEAAKIYAKRRGLGEEAVAYAHAVTIEALAQLGDMLKSMEKNKGATKGKTGSKGKPLLDPAPTLKELGVDKKTSMVAQRLSALPEKVREKIANQEKSLSEATGAHVSYNSGENEWYTPSPIIELARSVMYGIDLDPASTAAANNTVKAKKYYTKEDDGLTKPWKGKIWLNPPYAQPLLTQFIDKFIHELKARHLEEACILVNNATETDWAQRLMEWSVAMVLFNKRVRFLDPRGNLSQPLQGQMLLYYGGRDGLLNRLVCEQELGTVVSVWMPPLED